MLVRPNEIWLGALLFGAIACAGCSAEKPIASSVPAFHLTAFHNDSLLLTPIIPEDQPVNGTITLTLAGRMRPPANSDCSAERGPFRLEHAKGDPSSISISLPAPERWLDDLEGRTEPDSHMEVEALDAFLLDVDRLEQAGCFTDTSISIRDSLLQSIPLRPQDSYYNAYGYRLGRGVDLKPGIRLKIERAYFRAAMAGEEDHSPQAFLGLSTVLFDVEVTADRNTQLHQVGDMKYSPESLGRTVTEGSRDLELAGLPPEPRYRLYFYTDLVAEKHTRSAAVIGANSLGQVDEVDRQLRANRNENCKEVEIPGAVTCFAFVGFVTVSSEISVELNGKSTFIEWGTQVRDVLPKDSDSRILHSLSLQRRYGPGKYYDVRFKPADSNILSLWLVGGDRLTWSKRRPKRGSH